MPVTIKQPAGDILADQRRAPAKVGGALALYVSYEVITEERTNVCDGVV